MAGINANYSQFYKGTDYINGYGSGAGQKKSLVRYEFNTTDEAGNKIMDKMSKEETFRVMNEISAQYDDSVIVEFSGDGLTAFEQHMGKMPISDEPKREIPEDMITHLEGPKPLTAEEIKAMQGNQAWERDEDRMKKLDPKAYEEYAELKKTGDRDDHGVPASLKYMLNWTVNQAKKYNAKTDSYDNAEGFKKDYIRTDYNYEIASRIPSIYGDKDENGEYIRKFFSVSDVKNNLLKAYASIYDEIVKGYEAGTRETYVEDSTAENGYRKLTMDEELSELDKAYKNYVDRYASNRDKHVMDILSAHAKKLSEISGGRTKIADEVKELMERYKKDPVPEDFTDRMIKAAKTFVIQYKANKSVGIDALLQNILLKS